MQVEQRQWSAESGWDRPSPLPSGREAHLILVFGSTALLAGSTWQAELAAEHPEARIFGCSTAGEIRGTAVRDATLVATVVAFEHGRVEQAEVTIADATGSELAGSRLGNALPHEGLTHVLVLSDGLHVNGSALLHGLCAALPAGVAVTGGLAADGSRFERTLVVSDSGAHEHKIAAVGFYGERLHVGHGCLGGWDSFGPERRVTRARGNVLHELDGDSALALYQLYLGDRARDLPAAGLLFPLSIRSREGEVGVVRTILSIDEVAQTMTFAGDIPEGAYARLMKANFERLIDGAHGAAAAGHAHLGGRAPDLALLISCVGRKLVLGQRIEEEAEAVREVLGEPTVLAGYYSYGEIAPHAPGARCELHNQTMTITTFLET